MSSGLAIEKRNFTALDYLAFPMIRPNPRKKGTGPFFPMIRPSPRAVLTLTEKASYPLFFSRLPSFL